MRIRTASPLIAILALALFPACTNARDLGEGNSRYGVETVNLDVDSLLIGQVGTFRDVNHPAEAIVNNDNYGEVRSSSVQLDVYTEDNRWAMAGLYFNNVDLADLEVGQTYNFDAPSYNRDFDESAVSVEGIGCSSTADAGFDEPFNEVEVTPLEDGDEIVIDFRGTFNNGDELAGNFPLEGTNSDLSYY